MGSSPNGVGTTRQRASVQSAVEFQPSTIQSMQAGFLSQLDAAGDVVNVAAGEYREDDGVFVIKYVNPDHTGIEIGDVVLGEMEGGGVPLSDVILANLAVECDLFDDGCWSQVDSLPSLAGETESEMSADEGCSMTDNLQPTAMSLETVEALLHGASVGATACAESETPKVCNVETQTESETTAPPAQSEQASCSMGVQTEKPFVFYDPTFANMSVRPMRASASDGLPDVISMRAYILDCEKNGVKPGMVTPVRAVHAAQRLAAAHQSHANSARQSLQEERQAHSSEVSGLQEQHALELAALRAQHAQQLNAVRAEERAIAEKQLNSIREWKRIELQQAAQQKQAALDAQAGRHDRAPQQPANTSATWRRKRQNAARSALRSKAGRIKAEDEARIKESENKTLQGDNEALHAEVASRIKVAPQREGNGTRGAFASRTILRDLRVRQSALNSGAHRIREITNTYSKLISDDGRDLQLESGSLSTVLRWEKTAEVLCTLVEGQELRNTLRARPYTQFYSYCDLSPDSRAIEQFGMGLEYAGIDFWFADESDPTIFTMYPHASSGRLNGAPYMQCEGVQLGPDGCPVTEEWYRRVFTPMLEANGPKYAGTVDCFARTLQMYGSSADALLDPSFAFASAERADIEIPLVNRMEGITSDAGGETQKSGGVIQSVAPNVSWNHCGDHCLNLAARKSIAMDRVGSQVRQTSSFCRNGNKHSMLVHHMLRIQDPSLISEECEPRLRQCYLDAHDKLKQHGQFHEQLGGQESSAAQFGERLDSVEELQLVEISKISRKSKKGTDIRWKYELEVACTPPSICSCCSLTHTHAMPYAAYVVSGAITSRQFLTLPVVSQHTGSA